MKRIKFFIHTSGGILFAASLMLFVVSVGSAQVLALPELVLGIPLRFSLVIVGGMELAVALFCLFGTQIRIQVVLLAWMATNYILYRIALLLIHSHPQFTCIGSLTDPLHVSHGVTGFISGLITFYLLVGSYAAAIWLWFSKGSSALGRPDHQSIEDGGVLLCNPEIYKVLCPSCGGPITLASQTLCQKILCPNCKWRST